MGKRLPVLATGRPVAFGPGRAESVARPNRAARLLGCSAVARLAQASWDARASIWPQLMVCPEFGY